MSTIDCVFVISREMFEFNLFSVVRMVRGAIPHLLARAGGAIINISSTMARKASA